MRLTFGRASGAALLMALVGCGGRSTTTPAAGDDPADTGGQVGGSMPSAPESTDVPPSGASMDDPVYPSDPVPGTPAGNGTETSGGTSAGGGRAGSGSVDGSAGVSGNAVAAGG